MDVEDLAQLRCRDWRTKMTPSIRSTSEPQRLATSEAESQRHRVEGEQPIRSRGLEQ